VGFIINYIMYRTIQSHPFHLVEPSPWPLTSSIALLTTTIAGVMYFNNYANGGLFLTLGLIATVSSMFLWFRDIIIESNIVDSLNLTICWENLRTLSTNLFKELVKILKIGLSAGNQISNGILRDYTSSILKFSHSINNYNSKITFSNLEELKVIPDTDLGAYLAGLLEGDGSISIDNPKIERRTVNPAFIFTFDKNNLPLYEYLKSCIGSGSFQNVQNSNTMRYIIKDKKGVIKLVNLMNGYFRTPKIETFHKLINNLNSTHSLSIPLLPLNTSPIDSNAWFAGFTEADGYFGVKITEFKPKTESTK